MFSSLKNQTSLLNTMQLSINKIPYYVPYIITYFIGFIILLIILLFIYVRIKYRFWALQPVFHVYDLYYWFVNAGVINKELPLKNRYTNFKNIKTISFDILSKKDIKEFVLLVQLNYLRNKENTYVPQKENILPYFTGHNGKSLWSFYWQPELILDNKTNKTIEHEKLIGVITGRPLNVSIFFSDKSKDNNKEKEKELKVYYIDYLCVDKSCRNKGIAPQLIQTHEYNQSHLNRDICVSLFKREDELTGIVPLTVYKSYCFNMKNWMCPPPLNANMSLLQGDKQNMYYLYNFIKANPKKWELTIYPEMSNIMELIATKNLFITMIVVEGNIEAVYIFKKSCTFIEKGKEIICCIASMNGTLLEQDFIRGFRIALWSIVTRENSINHINSTNSTKKTKKLEELESIFCYLTVEDISDNKCIIKSITKHTYPVVVSPTAYFFYNFAFSTFKSESVLIIT
jgi:hypothetical protein